jgi:hypothetical protein
MFCFDFLYIDPSNDFCFCQFFAKGLKSEGERLRVNFRLWKWYNWAGVSKTIASVAVTAAFSRFVIMKTTV